MLAMVVSPDVYCLQFNDSRRFSMPNSPDINNVQRGLRIDRELDAKVLKKFKLDDDMTVKDVYILALQYATKDVELDEEDNKRIAEEKRIARIKFKNGKVK